MGDFESEPAFGNYIVNADGTMQLTTGDGVFTGAAATDGNSFVVGPMTSGQPPAVLVALRH